MKKENILLAHGSGGSLMHELIRGLLLKKLNNPLLKQLGDSALIDYKERIAFTTDSFVVSPIFFPGGDIGKLAVCGTVNDLVMAGAEPEYLSLALIIEEGFSYKTLEKIVGSISLNAKAVGVSFVTGDLKVVEKGSCDKIFINTSGIGKVVENRRLGLKNIEPSDKVIITGSLGEHGLAVLAKRKELDLGLNIKSDVNALNGLLIPILRNCSGIKFMRDPTRGGLAATLNEIAVFSGRGIIINEKELPVSAKVASACELLGIDPLSIANEGKAVIIVRPDQAEKVLRLLRKHPLGRHARLIGTVVKAPGAKVILNTFLGTQRIIDMPSGEVLPRIC